MNTIAPHDILPLKDRIIRSWPITVTIIYAIIVLWTGAWYMEPWRDLAHAWVVVRDGKWLDVFTTIPAHSHPFLWFLLLKPLAELGLPYQSSIILNGLFCIATAYLFLSRAPFPWWIKVLFVFSYSMIYEFAFPGRIYAMGVFFSFLICYFFDKRHEYPVLFSSLIALSFHTHSLFLSISAPVILLFFWESVRSGILLKRPYLIGFSLIALSGIYFLWYVAEVSQYTELLGKSTKTTTFVDWVGMAFLGKSNDWNFFGVLGLMLYLLTTLLRPPLIIALVLFSQGFLYYSYAHVTPQQIRYYLILFIAVLCWWWIAEKYKSPLKTSTAKKTNVKTKSVKGKAGSSPFKSMFHFAFLAALSICLFFSVFNGVQDLIAEIRLPHSNAAEVANFINTKLPKKTILAGHRSYIASAIVPYLPEDMKIWYADREEFGTYLKFDSTFYQNNLSVNFSEAIQNILRQFPTEQNLALILSINLPPEYNNQFRLVHTSKVKSIQADEFYYVYLRR